jgi:hypothetical protein
MNGPFVLESGLPLGMQVSHRGHREALLRLSPLSLGLVEVCIPSRMKGEHQTAMLSFAYSNPFN